MVFMDYIGRMMVEEKINIMTVDRFFLNPFIGGYNLHFRVYS